RDRAPAGSCASCRAAPSPAPATRRRPGGRARAGRRRTESGCRRRRAPRPRAWRSGSTSPATIAGRGTNGIVVARDGVFAGGPERFVESGALARLLQRLAEPRRKVHVPDTAHGFHAVWGAPLPRDLGALARAFAAVDMEWLGRWRPS